MSFSYKIKNKVMISKLGKEIDHHEAESIRRKLDQLITIYSIKVLILDFSETTFMDSSGIGIIMGRYRLMKHIGGEIGLVHVHENIERVLKVCGIYKFVKQYTSLSEAVKQLV